MHTYRYSECNNQYAVKISHYYIVVVELPPVKDEQFTILGEK